MLSRIPGTAVSKRGAGNGDMGESGENVRAPAGTALMAAQRILALAATESLDRAEAYVFPPPYHTFLHLFFY